MIAIAQSESSLLSLKKGATARITRAPDHPALAALGLRPGKLCQVLALLPCRGPLVCSIAGRQVALERALAAEVGVSFEQPA